MFVVENCSTQHASPLSPIGQMNDSARNRSVLEPSLRGS